MQTEIFGNGALMVVAENAAELVRPPQPGGLAVFNGIALIHPDCNHHLFYPTHCFPPRICSNKRRAIAAC